MTDLTNIFKGNDEFLDEIIILPVGTHGAGTYNLPAGYTWLDFESVEFAGAYSGDLTEQRGVGITSKETIVANPTGWSSRAEMSTATTNVWIVVTATSATTFTVANTASVLLYMKAYKKRYGTRNLSKTVNVNGGANIAINSRYEIDIASELGTEYLDRDLIVVAEIYNNSGTGEAGWGEAGYIFLQSLNASWGVKGSMFGSKIIVQTGGGLSYSSAFDGNPSGNTTAITSAPCRVKVWKVDQYLPTKIGSGGITEIITGSWGNGVTADWSGTGKILSQFDDIRIVGSVGTTSYCSVTVTPDQLLLPGTTIYPWVYTSSALISAGTFTETSCVSLCLGSGYVIVGIYGINYN